MTTSFIEPNEYDLFIINNGCGSDGLKSVIGTTDFLDFIFAEACKWHDYWYSKYSSVGRKSADDMFYEMMIHLIKKGNYGWFKRKFYTLIAKDYWRLVRWYGESSYQKYDIESILPSYKPYKNIKIRKLNKSTVLINNRWWFRDEAENIGLIKKRG